MQHKNKPRTEKERIAYEEGLADGKENSGIGIFSVFFACTIAILLFVDSPKKCVSELAGRLDRIERAISGGAQ